MQRGQIYQAHGSWHLRYRVDGKQVSRKLAPANDQFRTEKSVRSIADQILAPVNQGLESGGLQTLQQFIEATYLPHAKLHRKASTYHGYENLYNLRIKERIGGMRLATFRTVDGQKLLNQIYAADSKLSHQTMKNVKSVLSAVFTHARRMGSFEGPNPMDGTETTGQPSTETEAYPQSDIDTMVKWLGGVEQLAVIVAAYTGLSLEELQGLKWEDIGEDSLTVKRTIWRNIIDTPKTQARQDELPLLPIVKKALKEYHEKHPHTTWVFEGPYAEPYDMATMGSKKIKDGLERSGVTWRGWHAFRRGFATRLHEAGVQDRYIQALMRHSSLSVTMKHYVKANNPATVAAINKLTPPSAVPATRRTRKANKTATGVQP